MPNYAIYDTDIILNVIVADSKEIAEEATGLNALETVDGFPWVGCTLVDGEWIPPKPFDSWSWNGEVWEAPVPKPEGPKEYFWDENSQSWIESVVNNGEEV